MPGALRRLHGGAHGQGTTIDGFRFNGLMTRIALGGRRRRVYRQLVELSRARPGDRVLDVGSSSGYLARMLAAAVGPTGSVTGVDPSAAAIAHAGRRAPANASFTTGVAENLSAFDDASFDVVTTTLAIHHVPARKREAAVTEMYRVTRPGGHLLIADLDPVAGVPALHRGARRTRHAAATVGPLDELVAAAGYTVEAVGTLSLLRYVVATA